MDRGRGYLCETGIRDWSHDVPGAAIKVEQAKKNHLIEASEGAQFN